MPIHENIYLGREPGQQIAGLTIVDARKSRAMAAEHLDRLKIHVKSVDQLTHRKERG
jgi:simple sugar transport system ATP-binding protein